MEWNETGWRTDMQDAEGQGFGERVHPGSPSRTKGDSRKGDPMPETATGYAPPACKT